MTTQRRIDFTHTGRRNGPIRSVVDTRPLRNRLKPFVFLDHFDVTTSTRWGFDWHPHSGIITVTYALDSDLHHRDTDGGTGQLCEGGVQLMTAGAGVWHKEYYWPREARRVRGLQMWVALPPGLEHSEVSYHQATAAELPVVGSTRVLVGRFEEATSPLASPVDFNYLATTVERGREWTYQPPDHHDVAWLYVEEGAIRSDDRSLPAGTLASFTAGTAPIRLHAEEAPATVVIGTAPRHDRPLHASRGSIHTSRGDLIAGQHRIAQLQSTIRGQTTLETGK